MKKNAMRAVALAAVGLGNLTAHAVDAFDPATNLLTLESVSVGGQTYRNVAVTINSFSLIGIAGGSPAADAFDPASNTLVLGSVAFQGTTYTNATVKINSYTLLSAAGAPTPGTQAVANYPAASEAGGYFTALNNYRTQCGLPALSQNAALDVGSVVTATGPIAIGTQRSLALGDQFASARAAGYAAPTTVGALIGAYVSNSTDQVTVGKLIAQGEMADPYGLLTLMRPYTEIGLTYTTGLAGGTHQRFMQSMLGNPLSRGLVSPVTFPCANTTDIAPGSAAYLQNGTNYVGTPINSTVVSGIYAATVGTPISVMANPGDTLTLSSATVTLQGGSAVPVVLRDYTKSAGIVPNWPASANLLYSYEANVTPTSVLQANAAYNVVINGVMNGVPFNKTFTFRTGAPIQ